MIDVEFVEPLSLCVNVLTPWLLLTLSTMGGQCPLINHSALSILTIYAGDGTKDDAGKGKGRARETTRSLNRSESISASLTRSLDLCAEPNIQALQGKLTEIQRKREDIGRFTMLIDSSHTAEPCYFNRAFDV